MYQAQNPFSVAKDANALALIASKKRPLRKCWLLAYIRLRSGSQFTKKIIFFRTGTMIAVLIKMLYFWGLRARFPHKMSYFWDCNHDPSPHKMTCFWVFMRTATMIAVFTKLSYIWVFMRTATMIAVPRKCLIFEFLWRLRTRSHSSQNVLFLNHFSQRIAIMSRNPYKVYVKVKVKGRAISDVRGEG